MQQDGVTLHNVAAAPERDGGVRLQRVPEAVRTSLNEGSRERMLHPAGVEIRFVPDGSASVTLSATGRESPVSVFWGPFQHPGTTLVGSEPATIEVEQPDAVAALDPGVADSLAFSPDVCRVVLPGEHRGSPIVYGGTEGDVRAPEPDEVPDRRYLAYGTSITEGEAPSAEHLTYVSQTARRLEADLLNLGSCGSAYCDPAMAEHIAGRDDWDVATLALSVNMVGTFGVEEFRERAANMVDEVAGTGRPVGCITLYPYGDDLREDGDSETAAAFREALRDVVGDAPENVRLIEGSELLPPAGLTTDLVHPGDSGMVDVGERLAARLAPLV